MRACNAAQAWGQAIALKVDDTARGALLMSAANQLLLVEPESLRDPARAMLFALRLHELSGHQNAKHLATLAPACFRTKGVQQVIQWKEKALTLLPKEAPERSEFEDRPTEYQAALNLASGHPDRSRP